MKLPGLSMAELLTLLEKEYGVVTKRQNIDQWCNRGRTTKSGEKILLPRHTHYGRVYFLLAEVQEFMRRLA